MSWWTKLRDAAESVAVVAGNYFLPGSSIVTSRLVSEGAKEHLNTPIGQIAQLASGGYGASVGNLANYGKALDAARGALGISNAAAPITGADAVAAFNAGKLSAADFEALASGSGTTGSSWLSGMNLGTVLPVAAQLGGAALTSQAIGQAAETQATAANRAADLLYKQWREQVALQEPLRQAGITALNKMIPLLDYSKFGVDKLTLDPGYTFRLDEGRKQIERQAAARGGLISGAALKAAQRYGQEMASQEYQNAFNRSLVERQAALSPLQYLVGGGQTSAQQVGQAGQQYGRDVANLYTDIGASQAGAQLARGTTYAGALTGAANLYGQQQQNLLNQQLTNALIGRLQG
jgi:hypothetical protein